MRRPSRGVGYSIGNIVSNTVVATYGVGGRSLRRLHKCLITVAHLKLMSSVIEKQIFKYSRFCIYPREKKAYVYTKMYTLMFTTTIFTVAKN